MTRMLAEPDLIVLGAGIRLLMGEDHVVEWPGDSPDVTRAQLLRSRRKELHSSTLLIRSEVFDRGRRVRRDAAEQLCRGLRVPAAGRRDRPHRGGQQPARVDPQVQRVVVPRARRGRRRGARVPAGDPPPDRREPRRACSRPRARSPSRSSTMGQRKAGAVKIAGQAFRRWPVAPHAALAVVHSRRPASTRGCCSARARKAGRGIT